MRKAALLGVMLVGLMQIASQATCAVECREIASKIQSKNEDIYLTGLQELLDNSCEELLPKVEYLVTSRRAPLLLKSAITLALSGKKAYGPVLIALYYDATHLSPLSEEIYGRELEEAVLLACSDLPRGKRLADVADYRQLVYPPLSDACWEKYHSLFTESDFRDPFVSRQTLELLGETSSPKGIDLIARFMSVGDEYVRERAAKALQHLPLESAEALYRRALGDPNENVRYRAVRILMGKDDARVDSLFRDRLQNETSGQLIDMMKSRLGEDSKGRRNE
jgi:hypothetical protein